MSFFDRQRLAEFVNREAEMARFGEMLDNPEAHVFVVWGPGGVGKSSLQAKMWHEVATRGLLKSEVEWTETRNHDMVAITRKIRDDFALPAFDAFTAFLDRLDAYSETTANRAEAEIKRTLTRLAGAPHHGHRSRWPGLLEWSVSRWSKIIVYRETAGGIRIIAFYDARQDLTAQTPSLND